MLLRPPIHTAVTALVLAMAVLPGVGAAQSTAMETQTRPLLWRIGAGETCSYLFGTIHVADPRVLDIPAVVQQALASCEALRTEIPLDAATLQEVQRVMLLPEGRTLHDVLPRELVVRLEAFFEARQHRLEPFVRMKPWTLATLLGMLESSALFGEPLDQSLHRWARELGLETGGLETVDEQLAILDSLDDAAAAGFLQQTLDVLEENDDLFDQLVRVYLSGDVDALLQEILRFEAEASEEVQAYLGRILQDRNVVLAQRILAARRSHPRRRWFFAVGAGHLGGAEGILALLRENDVILTRVEE